MKLVVSCSDDKRIIVWCSSTNKKKFTLLGHQDYIRHVQFHNVYPWIVSASDDCTIRIWNWQSRSLVNVVYGHQHWINSLALHSSKDLMVSSSIDSSVRLWDFSTLRNKTCNTGKQFKMHTFNSGSDLKNNIIPFEKLNANPRNWI